MSRIAKMRQAKSKRRRKKKKEEEKNKSGNLQQGKNGMKFNVAEIAKMLEQMPSKQRKKIMKKIKKSADALGLDQLLKLQSQKNHKPGCECCIDEIFEKVKNICPEVPKDKLDLEIVEIDSDGEIPDLVPIEKEIPELEETTLKMSGPNNDILLKLLGSQKEEKEEEKEEEKVKTLIESPKNDALLKLLVKEKEETLIKSPKNDALLKLLVKEKEEEKVEILIKSPKNDALLELLKKQEEQKKLYDMRPNPPLTVLDILKQNDLQLPLIVEETPSEAQDTSTEISSIDVQEEKEVIVV